MARGARPRVSIGVTRQASWIDYDNDGDLDLFVAFRDQPNRLFRNDSGRFTDVTDESGIGDPRKTVGAVWFDIDADGDLDLFVANQNGDTNGLFRNDGGRFVDVAREWGVEAPRRVGGVRRRRRRRSPTSTATACSICSSPTMDRARSIATTSGRRFVDVTKEAGLFFDQHATTPSWGDYDNDGRPDLYVAGFLVTDTHYPDHLFHNSGSRRRRGSTDVLPALVNEHDASHGVQWVDFDGDGALDLALSNNDAAGGHYLFRNLLPPAVARQFARRRRRRRARPSHEGRRGGPGLRRPERGELISSGLVDTGGGYCSQNVMPVHVATADAKRVDVEVTAMGKGGRKVTKATGIDPRAARRTLVMRMPD